MTIKHFTNYFLILIFQIFSKYYGPLKEIVMHLFSFNRIMMPSWKHLIWLKKNHGILLISFIWFCYCLKIYALHINFQCFKARHEIQQGKSTQQLDNTAIEKRHFPVIFCQYYVKINLLLLWCNTMYQVYFTLKKNW